MRRTKISKGCTSSCLLLKANIRVKVYPHLSSHIWLQTTKHYPYHAHFNRLSIFPAILNSINTMPLARKKGVYVINTSGFFNLKPTYSSFNFQNMCCLLFLFCSNHKSRECLISNCNKAVSYLYPAFAPNQCVVSIDPQNS